MQAANQPNLALQAKVNLFFHLYRDYPHFFIFALKDKQAFKVLLRTTPELRKIVASFNNVFTAIAHNHLLDDGLNASDFYHGKNKPAVQEIRRSYKLLYKAALLGNKQYKGLIDANIHPLYTLTLSRKEFIHFVEALDIEKFRAIIKSWYATLSDEQLNLMENKWKLNNPSRINQVTLAKGLHSQVILHPLGKLIAAGVQFTPEELEAHCKNVRFHMQQLVANNKLNLLSPPKQFQQAMFDLIVIYAEQTYNVKVNTSAFDYCSKENILKNFKALQPAAELSEAQQIEYCQLVREQIEKLNISIPVDQFKTNVYAILQQSARWYQHLANNKALIAKISQSGYINTLLFDAKVKLEKSRVDGFIKSIGMVLNTISIAQESKKFSEIVNSILHNNIYSYFKVTEQSIGELMESMILDVDFAYPEERSRLNEYLADPELRKQIQQNIIQVSLIEPVKHYETLVSDAITNTIHTYVGEKVKLRLAMQNTQAFSGTGIQQSTPSQGPGFFAQNDMPAHLRSNNNNTDRRSHEI